MEHNTHQSAPASFWEHLLDRIAPTQAASSSETVTDQIMCGRWLALCRLRMGLIRSNLAARAWISADDLLVLEAGVAPPSLLSPAKRQRLATLLADETHEPAMIASICALAQGQQVDDAGSVLHLVYEELDAYQVAVPMNEQTCEEMIDELINGVASPEPHNLPRLEKRPLLLKMLVFLQISAADEFDIWRWCKSQAGMVSMVEVADALGELVTAGWAISRQVEHTRHSDIPCKRYVITPEGQSALARLPEVMTKPVLEHARLILGGI